MYWVTHVTNDVTYDIILGTRMSWFDSRQGHVKKYTSYICSINFISYIYIVYIYSIYLICILYILYITYICQFKSV